MRLIAITAAIAGLSLGQAWANESKLSDTEMDGVAAGTYMKKAQNTGTRTVQRGYKNQNAIADDGGQIQQNKQHGLFNQSNQQQSHKGNNTAQNQNGLVNVGAQRSFNDFVVLSVGGGTAKR